MPNKTFPGQDRLTRKSRERKEINERYGNPRGIVRRAFAMSDLGWAFAGSLISPAVYSPDWQLKVKEVTYRYFCIERQAEVVVEMTAGDR
jgi:hypothetical protein